MSSPIPIPSEVECESSEDSTHTVGKSKFHPASEDPIDISTMNISSETRVFGTAIQKFSKDLIKSLGNFKFSDELTDENYVSWSQAVSELLQSIDLDLFITSQDYIDPSLTPLENEKTRFIVTMFILNHLDSNNNLRTRNHLSDPKDPHVLIYDPCKTWSFLKKRHAKITEVKLSVVTKALYTCTIHQNDTLSSYLDKFENLIRQFYLYKGQMSDHQSARMLVDSITTLTDTTRELIHAQVNPFTRQGVADYLREFKTRQGWMSPAMREANAVESSQTSRPKKNSSRVRCTKEMCQGPHPKRTAGHVLRMRGRRRNSLLRNMATGRTTLHHLKLQR